jgi:hypothetical protein
MDPACGSNPKNKDRRKLACPPLTTTWATNDCHIRPQTTVIPFRILSGSILRGPEGAQAALSSFGHQRRSRTKWGPRGSFWGHGLLNKIGRAVGMSQTQYTLKSSELFYKVRTELCFEKQRPTWDAPIAWCRHWWTVVTRCHVEATVFFCVRSWSEGLKFPKEACAPSSVYHQSI